MVRLLLDHGANIDRAFNSNTPLSIAARIGAAECVQVLLDKGYRSVPLVFCPLMCHCSADAMRRNDDNLLPVQQAAKSGSVATVSALLDARSAAGVRVTYDDSTLSSLLSFASSSHHLTVLRMLLVRGIPVDPADQAIRTPLCAAAKHNFVEGVRLLVQFGADVNREAPNGTIFFHGV